MISNFCLVKDAVDDAFIEHVSSQAGQFIEGKTGRGVGSTDFEMRKSEVFFFREPMNQLAIYNKIEDLFYTINQQLFNYHLSRVETIQYTQYDSSYQGEYGQHSDTLEELTFEGFQRKLSISIQLSEPYEYEGGDFVFDGLEWENDDYKQKGTAIIFPSYMRHQVTPVTEGCRRSLVSWCYGPNFR